jgi:hypothetical protein
MTQRRWAPLDFLNLGVAHKAPQGATNLAPRAGRVSCFVGVEPFPRRMAATEPQLLNFYLFPPSIASMGPQIRPPNPIWPLIPNPYTPTFVSRG